MSGLIVSKNILRPMPLKPISQIKPRHIKIIFTYL